MIEMFTCFIILSFLIILDKNSQFIKFLIYINHKVIFLCDSFLSFLLQGDAKISLVSLLKKFADGNKQLLIFTIIWLKTKKDVIMDKLHFSS